MTELPNLCLNMIVKDESHIIRETLESVCKHIQYYVISDTGSSDNTVEIIENYFKEKGIKGEIFHDEWKGFDHNRSLALKHAKGKSKYIWVIDADDVIVGNLVFPELTADYYYIQIGKGFTYRRKNIFKNFRDYTWRYVEPIHEYPDCDKPNLKGGNIQGDYHLSSRRLGNRSMDPNKYLKDAKILEEALKINPNNPRNVFYCGRSYYDHGMHAKAIEYYEKRATMDGYQEEVYYSLYQIALAKMHLGESWENVEKALIRAYEHSNHRVEPIYLIAKHYRLNNKYQEGFQFANTGVRIKYPEQALLFLSADIYKWNMLEEYALFAYYTNRYKESYKAYKKLIKFDDIGEIHSKRIISGYNFAESKIQSINKESCLIHFTNKMITLDSKVWDFVNDMKFFYTVTITGKYIEDVPKDINYIDEIFVKGKSYDLLVAYDAINCLNYSIQATSVVLYLEDPYIKYLYDGSVKMKIFNFEDMKKYLPIIKRVVCKDEQVMIKFYNNYHFAKQSPIFSWGEPNDFDLSVMQTNWMFDMRHIENKQYEFEYPLLISELIKQTNLTNSQLSSIDKIMNKMEKEKFKQSEVMFERGKLKIKQKDYVKGEMYLKNAIQKSGADGRKDIQDILIELCKCYLEMGKHTESFALANNILNKGGYKPSMKEELRDIRDKNIDHVKDLLLKYPKDKIENIKSAKLDGKNVVLTMTTCKRYDLFEKTINSFINCCNDYLLVDKWIIIDDNSSNEDQQKMKDNYPFFKFIFKSPSQKGHVISMNMIRDLIKGYKYNIHLEDDFHFIEKREYITDSIDIMNEDQIIGQVLFNKNYAEIEPYKQRLEGGLEKKTKNGKDYVLHEFISEDAADEYQLKGLNNSNWPHYSLRPGLTRVDTIQELGPFHKSKWFEFDYAKVYKAKGYKTAFIDTFSCIHIGKKTWESGENSYNLNNVTQFYNNENVDSLVISWNSKKGIERWIQFKNNIHQNKKLNSYTRYEVKSPFNWLEIEGGFTYDYLNKYNGQNLRLDKISYLMTHRSIWDESIPNKWILVLDDHIEFNRNISQYCDELIENNKDGVLGYCFGKRSYLINSEGANVFKNIKFNDTTLDAHLKLLIDLSENKSIIEQEITLLKNNLPKLEGYKFYPGLDSFGGDWRRIEDKNPAELKSFVDNNPDLLGFNTLGYVKNKLSDEKDFIIFPNFENIRQGLYVKNDNMIIRGKINSIIKNLSRKDRKINNLTFTITSCKRLEYFIETMNTLLIKCEDLHKIDHWLCVDDNSSDSDVKTMKNKYPFLEIVHKNKDNKGHAKSMNIILDKVKTDYVMHFEDDWKCKDYFKIGPLLALIDDNIFDQVVLHRFYGEFNKINDISLIDLYRYKYNPNHVLKPDKYIDYELKMEMSPGEKSEDKDWWWPGFTLNPSLFNIKKFKEKVGRFNETIDQDLFEYDYAIKGYQNNMVICFVNKGIDHIGKQSSYLLN